MFSTLLKYMLVTVNYVDALYIQLLSNDIDVSEDFLVIIENLNLLEESDLLVSLYLVSPGAYIIV